jgi:hypothetical protein
MSEQRPQQSRRTGARSEDQSVRLDHESTRELAYQLWILRARPEGSPEVDWYRAEHELQNAIASAAKAA